MQIAENFLYFKAVSWAGWVWGEGGGGGGLQRLLCSCILRCFLLFPKVCTTRKNCSKNNKMSMKENKHFLPLDSTDYAMRI